MVFFEVVSAFGDSLRAEIHNCILDAVLPSCGRPGEWHAVIPRLIWFLNLDCVKYIDLFGLCDIESNSKAFVVISSQLTLMLQSIGFCSVWFKNTISILKAVLRYIFLRKKTSLHLKRHLITNQSYMYYVLWWIGGRTLLEL